jgi:hypothetical protein
MQLTFNPPTKSASPSEQTATKRRRSDRIRDHLANERTYLAWMRSAICFAAALRYRANGIWNRDCADSDVSTASDAINWNELETWVSFCSSRTADRVALNTALFWSTA